MIALMTGLCIMVLSLLVVLAWVVVCTVTWVVAVFWWFCFYSCGGYILGEWVLVFFLWVCNMGVCGWVLRVLCLLCRLVLF